MAALLSVLVLLLPCAQADDQKFETLEVGGVTYSNVTVMNKNATHVFITHGKSMASFRVTDLPPELQRELGYAPPEPPKPKQNPLTQLTEDPEIVEMQTRWQNEASLALARADSRTLAGIGVGVVLVYLLFCYFCMLICRKAGYDPGIWVWIPIAQVFSLLRGARMSGWNFLLIWIPLIGTIVSIVWCFKICIARGKSAWLGLLFFIPGANLFLFLYLALADGQEAEEGVVKLQFT